MTDPRTPDQILPAVGQLSERDEKIAKALAKVETGSTTTAAAREAGIPKTTLHDALVRMREASQDVTTARAIARDGIADAATVLAQGAMSRLAEKVLQGDLDHDAKALAVVAGIATDKLEVLHRIAQDTQGDGTEWLLQRMGKLLDGGDGEVEVKLSVHRERDES